MSGDTHPESPGSKNVYAHSAFLFVNCYNICAPAPKEGLSITPWIFAERVEILAKKLY